MRKISHAQNKEPILEYILSEIRLKKAESYIKDGSIVADLGCGYNGNFLRKISNKISLGVGYDVSVKNKNLPKNIFLRISNINKKINTKGKRFDIVTALAVIEHVKNPESFLKNVRGMLKKGGKVIITTPHKNGKIILEFLSYKLGLISRDEIDDHKNYYDQKTLRDLLKKSGYKILDINSFGLGWLNIFCRAQKI